jgi:hypothetical protein
MDQDARRTLQLIAARSDDLPRLARDIGNDRLVHWLEAAVAEARRNLQLDNDASADAGDRPATSPDREP